MEECTKLGVMDFGQSLHSPNEYKNDVWSLVPSSQESGYESALQSSTFFSNSSCDSSNDLDSLSLDETSLTTGNNHGVSSSQEEDFISNKSEHHDYNNDILLLKPSKSVNKICCTGKEISTEQVEESSGQETTFSPRIRRMDSLDIVEETAISIDETNPPNGFDDFDSSRPTVPTQIVYQETHEATKIRCPCKTHPTLKISELKRRGMETDWLRLETRLHGHFIQDCSHEIQQKFKLKYGDRLISVNEEDVHNLRHDAIVQKINDVIHMETKQTLVIERHSHRKDDEKCLDIYRYEIQLEFLEEDGGNTFLHLTSRLLKQVWQRFSVIYNLECDGQRKCWISHYTDRTDRYLCPGNENPDRLLLRCLPSNEDPKFQFSWCEYHGFRKDGNENVVLFLLTLMSKETDGYLCVGTKGNVRLKRYEYETEKMTSIANPLPYVFICRKCQDGSYNLESLNHEGWFLRWNKEENKMDIEQRDQRKDQPDFLFNIHTDAASVKPSVHR